MKRIIILSGVVPKDTAVMGPGQIHQAKTMPRGNAFSSVVKKITISKSPDTRGNFGSEGEDLNTSGNGIAKLED